MCAPSPTSTSMQVDRCAEWSGLDPCRWLQGDCIAGSESSGLDRRLQVERSADGQPVVKLHSCCRGTFTPGLLSEDCSAAANAGAAVFILQRCCEPAYVLRSHRSIQPFGQRLCDGLASMVPVSGACAPSDVPASTALSTDDSAFTRAEWGVEPLPIDSWRVPTRPASSGHSRTLRLARVPIRLRLPTGCSVGAIWDGRSSRRKPPPHRSRGGP